MVPQGNQVFQRRTQLFFAYFPYYPSPRSFSSETLLLTPKTNVSFQDSCIVIYYITFEKGILLVNRVINIPSAWRETTQQETNNKLWWVNSICCCRMCARCQQSRFIDLVDDGYEYECRQAGGNTDDLFLWKCIIWLTFQNSTVSSH